jgi:hypothetical protein
MTYINKVKVEFDQGPQVDAFQRNRVSNPSTISSSKLLYNDPSWAYNDYEHWELVTSGTTASGSSDPDSNCFLLHTGTTSGDRTVRQQHIYNSYQPGRSQLVVMTGVFEPKVNTMQCIGYYDDNDGLFFVHDGTNMNVARRSSATGTVVDTLFPQHEWDDPMDGSGKSGIEVDWSKAQIFMIDFQWLSVGRVRFCLDVDGSIIIVHELKHANNVELPYMSTADLPVRFEIENTGTTSSPTILKQICCAVIGEGDVNDAFGKLRSVSNESSLITINSSGKRPLLHIKPKLTFRGKPNKNKVLPIEVEVITDTNDVVIYWEVFVNCTMTGGSHSWQNPGDNVTFEYDVSRTGTSVNVTSGVASFSGYTVSQGGFFSSSGGQASKKFDVGLVLGTNFDLTAADVLTVAASTDSGSAVAGARLEVREQF